LLRAILDTMAREGDAAPPVIRFYSVSDEYGEFSNFARYSIQLEGKRWPTSEHYFQAQKFADVRDQEEIRRASTPMLAAQWVAIAARSAEPPLPARLIEATTGWTRDPCSDTQG
jgi:predicted NAD-dependent protein-ADP-ribosyltransferase YbiA (DUF1768 family)